MSKSATFVVATVASLIAGVFIATSSNAQSRASDEAYCRALVNAYSMGHGERGFSPVGNDTAVAIAQCQEGDPAPAIPVLEQKLRDGDITVPARN
jgi:hypothetical protein